MGKDGRKPAEGRADRRRSAAGALPAVAAS